MEWIEHIFYWIRKVIYFLWFDHQGHVAHFIVGIIIGALVSVVVLKKVGSKAKAVIIGFAVAAFIGLAKEMIDPYVGRNRDAADFYYTCYGGLIGCLSVLSDRLLKIITPQR
jgi:hypothetical protein